jgi:hypothetical protein
MRRPKKRGDPCHKDEGGASTPGPRGIAAFAGGPGGRSLGRMTGRPENVEHAPRKRAERARRQRRLGAALRENLKRRKAQAKGRATAAAADEPHDSAGIGADKQSR